MATAADAEQLEALLAHAGKKELAFQQLIETLPGEIRRHAVAGDHATADQLERDLRDARTMLLALRKEIASMEAKLYSRRR